MKHFAKFAALAAVVGLWSCSDDAPEVNPGAENSDGDFFAKITLQLPTSTGSRASTQDPAEGNDPAQSTDGYEFGKDYENNVNSLYVVLATADENGEYRFVASAEGTPVQVTPGSTESKTQPTFVMQFPTDALKAYAADDEGNTTPLYVFAFCNPGEAKGTLTGTDFVNATGTVEVGKLWIAAKSNFLMSNAELRQTSITKTWNQLAADCGTRENAYDLTNGKPVKVERVASRFDFMRTNASEDGGDVYEITDNTTTDGTVYAKVELQQMALFNEAKKFYILRHTQEAGTDGAPTGNVTLCGTEYGDKTTDNYVVSPNWATYLASADNKDNFPNLSKLFNYPLTTITTAADTEWTSIGSLTEDDTDGSTQDPTWSFADTDYKIWRYTTENTIPGTQNQRQGITTGVVFKGEIKAATTITEGNGLDNKIAAAIAAQKPIYAYREADLNSSSKSNLTMLFGTALDMYNYVASHIDSPQRTNFIKAWQAGDITVTIGGNKIVWDEETPNIDSLFPKATTGEDGSVQTPVVEVTAPTDNETLKAYNLICYTADNEGKYYCYYYYYNRHNNNDDNSAMGVMEFATVRNNIYKLKVDNVLTLGLPTDTPPDPWTPDESPEVYFKVSVKVLDWVVRKNNIIF